MLIWLTIPFADSRRFVEGQYSMVNRPSWPKPAPGEEFVRGFGGVKQRNLGGISFWGEDAVCDLRHALRIRGLTTAELRSGRSVPVQVAFRRLYFDGLAVGKFEIAFATAGRGLCLSGPEVAELINELLETTVSVHIGRYKAMRPLFECGKRLLEAYAQATTRSAKEDRTIPGWVLQLGSPLIFIQAANREQESDLPHSNAIAVERFKLRLHFGAHRYGKRRVRTWIMNTSAESDKTNARELRISLARLHVEQQVLPRICRNIKEDRLSQAVESPEVESLLLYLDEATTRISKKEKALAKICAVGDVVDLSRSLVDSLAPGERDAVLSLLRSVRAGANLVKKVAVRTQIIQNQTNNFMKGEVRMSGDQYTIHGGAGAVGPGARAEKVIIHNSEGAAGLGTVVGLSTLIAELNRLQTELVAKASKPEEFQAISNVVAAKEAAEAKKPDEVVSYLKKAGAWVLKVAQDIGVSVTAKMIEDSMKIG